MGFAVDFDGPGVYSDKIKTEEKKEINKVFDIEIAVDAFRSMITSMDVERRNAYLHNINLKYDKIENIDTKINEELINVSNNFNKLNQDSKNCLIIELLNFLEYDKIINLQKCDTEQTAELKRLKRNAKIISCVYPEIDFARMLEFFETNKEKIDFVIKCHELVSKYDIKTCLDGYGVQKIK